MNEIVYTDVAVWLPTYNEEMNIEKMVTDIRHWGFTVYVTDGGSTDNTVNLAKQMGVEVFMRTGHHKGYGIQRAMEESLKRSYDKMIYIDCDQTYPVSRLPEMYELSMENDIVIGARDFSKIVFLNRMANYFFTGLINMLFSGSLSDTQSGMRIFHINKFIGHIHSNQFDLEAELSCFALKNKFRIKELPVDYYERVGESKTSIYQAILILRRIFICRFMD